MVQTLAQQQKTTKYLDLSSARDVVIRVESDGSVFLEVGDDAVTMTSAEARRLAKALQKLLGDREGK